MINEKNKFLTVSWLSGLLSAEIFISTGEWGVQMPPLTSENSHFLRSGPQGSTLVMYWTYFWKYYIYYKKDTKVGSQNLTTKFAFVPDYLWYPIMSSTGVIVCDWTTI